MIEWTIEFTGNEKDGWTAQIVEFPAAISQGRTLVSAARNVIQALVDLGVDLA